MNKCFAVALIDDKGNESVLKERAVMRVGKNGNKQFKFPPVRKLFKNRQSEKDRYGIKIVALSLWSGGVRWMAIPIKGLVVGNGATPRFRAGAIRL